MSYGILNEIYYPTIDRPQVRDMQFLVTDGDQLFHEERRHLVSQVDPIEGDALGYRIVNTRSRAGGIALVKEVIADPHEPCVLIETALEGEPAFLDRLTCTPCWRRTSRSAAGATPRDASGWATRKVLVAWKGGTWLAMGADVGFSRASCGYVGASDGWQDLHDNCRLDWEFDEALDGNVAMIGQVRMPAEPTVHGGHRLRSQHARRPDAAGAVAGGAVSRSPHPVRQRVAPGRATARPRSGTRRRTAAGSTASAGTCCWPTRTSSLPAR